MAVTEAEIPSNSALPKCPTGIQGLDEIIGGGLPRGRPTLVAGAAGCGKTMLSIEFLVRGAAEYGEPGVFVSFEESAEELTANVRSLGFDLDDLVTRDKLVVDYVYVERSEITETGEYDLEGLFVRLGYAIDSIGAKRVVLDTIEVLFAGLSNDAVLRSELRRLFRWLKARGITVIITAERGPEGGLTRHGLEEYVSDCVIALDHRVAENLSTRRLRVVKYRGSHHGTNEYPFLIGDRGISVLPITSLRLDHSAPTGRVSSGIPGLDEMLTGKGYYRGSSILVSGTAGTGKTSIAAHFVGAACARGERALFFSFEESEAQIVRNMRSIGIGLEPWVDRGLLEIHSSRPTHTGLESHLVAIHDKVAQFHPTVAVIDPITNFLTVGSGSEVKAMLVRLIDFLKTNDITALFTSLVSMGANSDFQLAEASVSSLIDTWIMVRDLETGGERNRGIYVIKSRGMAHSHQVREFLLTDKGVELVDVYAGPRGVLTGAARISAQQAEAQSDLPARQQHIDRPAGPRP